MKKKWVIIFFVLLGCLIFWQFFFRGLYPISGNFLLAWYEPWKTNHTIDGTITIAHKPVIDDAFRHLYPLRVLASDLIKRGQWPLWNPYNGAGTPLLSIMHPGYLNPFGLFFLLFPPEVGWLLYIGIQPIVLGLCTYVYCRKIGIGPLGAIAGAVTLLFSGFVQVRLFYGEFLYVLAGLPVLLYLIEEYREHQKSLWVFLIPFVVCFLFLSGQPHMIIYVLGISGIYSVYRLWSLGKERVGILVLLFVLVLLGIGMAGVQLIPSFELYGLSTITQHSSKFIFERFLLPISHLLTLVIPNYFGNHATYNYFGAGGDSIETAAAIGALPIFFAIIALIQSKTARIDTRHFWLAVAIIGILSTLRWSGSRFLYSLPIPVLSSDVPSRVFVLSSFALSILAAYGVNAFFTLKSKDRGMRYAVALFTAGMLLLVVVTIIVYLAKVPCPSVQVTLCRLVSLRNTVLEVATFFSGLLLFVLGIFWKKHRKTLSIGIISFIVIVGLYNSYKFLPFSPKSSILPITPVTEAMQEKTRDGRVFGFGQANLLPNFATQFRIYDPSFYDPLHIKRYAELVGFANSGDPSSDLDRSDVLIIRDATPSASVSRRRKRLLDLLSVKYFLFQKTEVPQDFSIARTPLWEDNHWYLTQNTNALPRAFLVGQYEVVSSGNALLSRLFDPTFDPHQTVLVEEDPKFEQATGEENHKDVSIITYDEQRVTLKTEAMVPSLLVLTDNDYPGWKAYVDGKETPTYRANYTFRAVQVPQGPHEVDFVYAPESLRFGMQLSAVSLGALCLVVILRRKR